MSEGKRVVISGMGLVSCFGSEVDLFYENLLQGKSGVRPIVEFPCEDFPTRIAASVQGIDEIAESYIDKKLNRRLDPYIRYSIVAGKRALESAGLDPKKDFDERALSRSGVIVGTGVGGMHMQHKGFQAFADKGYSRVSPFYCPFVLTNMGSALLGLDLGFTGPNYSLSTACATANYCFLAAADHIRKGEADIMLAGGSEAAISSMCIAGFIACKAVSRRNEEPTKASAPWDKKRDGFVMGEGAAVLVLEELEHAKARGATIYAELKGGATTSDAYHMTDPHPQGKQVAQCLKKALVDSGIQSEEVNYINAHATSTMLGDLAELRALKQVFAPRDTLKINGTKSMIGHALGAAGGLEAIACIQAIRTQKLHPTINLEEPENELQFDAIAEGAVDHPTDYVVNNSFGFGGHNSVVIFGRYN